MSVCARRFDTGRPPTREVRHHDAAQRAELGVYLGIVDAPEAVELQHALVPLNNGHHAVVGLVANDLKAGRTTL